MRDSDACGVCFWDNLRYLSKFLIILPAGCLNFGPIEKYYVFGDLSVREKAWCAASQAFERMHNTLSPSENLGTRRYQKCFAKVFVCISIFHHVEYACSYLPSTEAQVLKANVAQLMPAYSSLQSPGSPTGPPDCANDYTLKTILRERFGAENISVISDNGGIAMVYQTHKCKAMCLLCGSGMIVP